MTSEKDLAFQMLISTLNSFKDRIDAQQEKIDYQDERIEILEKELQNGLERDTKLAMTGKRLADIMIDGLKEFSELKWQIQNQ